MVFTSLVPGSERSYKSRIEDASIQSSRTQNVLIKDVPEFAAEPSADRNWESHLWAFQYLFRKEPLHGPPQDPFSVCSPQLHLDGHPGGKFGEFMIQEWD